MIEKLKAGGFGALVFLFVFGTVVYFTPVVTQNSIVMADGGGQGDADDGETDGSPDDVPSGEGDCFVNTCVDPWAPLPN